MPLDIINCSNNNNIHLGHRCQNAIAIYVITRTDMLYYYHMLLLFTISKVDVRACVFSVIQHEI